LAEILAEEDEAELARSEVEWLERFRWLRKERPHLLDKYEGTQRAPLRHFSEILPTKFGTWDAQPESLERTIRYANRRLLPWRWIGRMFGI
jgi:hypothetical protein